MNKLYGLALLLACTAAHGNSSFDVYYIPSADFEGEAGALRTLDDGDGYGARAEWFADRQALAFVGEYQGTNYEAQDAQLDQWRAGFGIFGRTRNGLIIQYVNMDFEGNEADGYAGHLRFSSGRAHMPQMQTQIGYLRLKDDTEDLEGLEYAVELIVPFDDGNGAFLNYRVTRLEFTTTQDEMTLEDVRFGVRIAL